MYDERGTLGAAPIDGVDHEARAAKWESLAVVLVSLPVLVSFLGIAFTSLMLLTVVATSGVPLGARVECGLLCLVTWAGFVVAVLLTRMGAVRGFGGKSARWTAVAVVSSALSLPWTLLCFGLSSRFFF